MKYIQSPEELEQFASHLMRNNSFQKMPENMSLNLQIEDLESWEKFFPEGHTMREMLSRGFTYQTDAGIDFYIIYVGSPRGNKTDDIVFADSNGS